MNKIKLEHLDIPIIRSCNLACVGCITHSNHKNIKGLVRLEESLEWLQFWASRVESKSVTLFGGEPLLHPEFTEWALEVKRLWSGENGVGVNTNGYYLDTLYDKIPELFNLDMCLNVIVSIQTGTEPYLSKVRDNIATLKQKILEYHLTQPGVKTADWDLWLDESAINNKQWFRLRINGVSTPIGFTVCDQYQLHWCSHYTGYGESMRPVYNYEEQYYAENHSFCQAKNFVTLYRGTMYKCPPIGVLNHSLTTFNLTENADWRPYLTDYQSVGTSSSDEEITEWFKQQKNPEKVCNMCGFAGPGTQEIKASERSHILKDYWNYTL